LNDEKCRHVVQYWVLIKVENLLSTTLTFQFYINSSFSHAIWLSIATKAAGIIEVKTVSIQ
jgi:hypothetical protein